MRARFPIYVISKGRWSRRQTIKSLEAMGVNYRLVIEPAEFDKYAEVVNPAKIITTPENFSERDCGSIPVRNFVWEHSISEGHARHWILDDNLEYLGRYNNNLWIPCKCETPFRVMEDFVLRYKNIGLAAPNYVNFCPASEGRPPFQMNTRVYSCILINNSLGFRWRGRYNEDTDLSLRCMKAGFNTILFNAFLIAKRATMCQKGGNEDIYNNSDNRKEFAESLKEFHPDVVKVVWRFNRWHHQVNYKPFKGRGLEYRDDYVKPDNKVNEYGMVLNKVEEKSW